MRGSGDSDSTVYSTKVFDVFRQITSLEQEVQALKRSKVGFHPVTLPEGLSLTSSDVINSLNEHLLHVLSTLRQREQEVGVAQEALEKYQRKFSVIIHQQVKRHTLLCDIVL